AALSAIAQLQLWRRWVSLSVGTWTGEAGPWALKVAPLMAPPFRAVFLNCNGDFFPGTISNVRRHCREPLRAAINRSLDSIRDSALRVTDLAGAYAVSAVARVL